MKGYRGLGGRAELGERMIFFRTGLMRSICWLLGRRWDSAGRQTPAGRAICSQSVLPVLPLVFWASMDVIRYVYHTIGVLLPWVGLEGWEKLEEMGPPVTNGGNVFLLQSKKVLWCYLMVRDAVFVLSYCFRWEVSLCKLCGRR